MSVASYPTFVKLLGTYAKYFSATLSKSGKVFAKQKVIQFSFKNGVSALPKEASLMFHEPIELPQCMPLIYQVIARVGR